MIKLTLTEQNFLEKQIKKERFYLYFCLLDIIAALSILFYIVFQSSFDSTRLIIMIILLINSKINLKQYKNIKLLKKLSRQ